MGTSWLSFIVIVSASDVSAVCSRSRSEKRLDASVDAEASGRDAAAVESVGDKVEDELDVAAVFEEESVAAAADVPQPVIRLPATRHAIRVLPNDKPLFFVYIFEFIGFLLSAGG